MLEELQEETLQWSEHLRSEYAAVARCAVFFLHEEVGLQVEQAVAEQWLSRMHLNTFELGRNFGAVMFSTMSFFNHACNPSVTTIPVDDCQYLFAARDIMAGEEVFTHYVNVDQPLQHRRKQLMTSFRFLCECDRCLKEASVSSKKAQRQNGRRARQAAGYPNQAPS
eukprot:CAMPEP_0179180546 /NCGR_PEP_ID=MMETSP0796-20121207/89385_1 /TAXON_ID=73915 /ORGANISM="Pyrodinium bahamense, Strain pbaha01" /LENGTH=166 /DNA_ID=CAMNT_0020884259 /DNA_START=250 /DNA_END=750 /DNA_ORIENTATION=-